MILDLFLYELLYHRPEILNPYDLESIVEANEACMKDLRSVVSPIAVQYGINPNWILAIIQKESGGNPYEIRYEPHYCYLQTPEKYAKALHITLQTEIESQKISWGLGQIMGAVARAQGHNGLMSQMIEPELNVKHMCILISHLRQKSHEQNDIFAMYNAGYKGLQRTNGQYPNQTYVDQVNEILKTFK